MSGDLLGDSLSMSLSVSGVEIDTQKRSLARSKRRTEAGADLTNADFRGADLRGAWLGNSPVRGAKFRGADLRGATMYTYFTRNANLEGARR